MIDAAQADEVKLCTSQILLAELARILRRAKFIKAVMETLNKAIFVAPPAKAGA